MKRGSLVVWSVFLVLTVVAAGAGAMGALTHEVRAQEGYVAYLPLVANEPAGPVIDYFRANVEIADPGETIWLEWASTGGVTASIWRVERGGPIAQMWDVAPTGSMTYTINTWEREYMQFSLWVSDAEVVSTSTGLTIPLTCPDTWFFEPAPDGCPGEPALFADGAEQKFEHGYMVWVGEVNRIYVLYADNVFSPRWAAYTDTYEEGEELCDPGEPPVGRMQPQRGFGKLWCEEPGVSDRLGWAVEPEKAYETALQRDSAPKYSTFYLRSADYNVWKLLPERSAWEKIITE